MLFRISEVLIKVKLAGVVRCALCSELYASFLIVTYTLLEEVGLALERDHVHPFEGILDVVVLGNAKLEQKAIGYELDVLVHQSGIHTDKLYGKRLGHKVLLNADSFSDYLKDSLVSQFVVQMLVKETGKVSVHAFITRDQFVGESESGHETSLFHPKDSTEGAREEDAFDSSESDKALCKAIRRFDPLEGPVGLHLHALNVVNCLEKIGLFSLVIDIGIDEDRVGLRVDILHHHLEAIKTTSLWHLDLRCEALSKILKYYPV